MTLEEAIEVFYQKQLVYCRDSDVKFRNALKIGMKAVKLEIRRREKSPSFYTERLPGETEE